VEGHADREERALARDERLNIEAYLLAYKRREEARGPYGAEPNCPHWPVEKITLFIQGTKVTSGMKQLLASQLSEGKLKDYIIENENGPNTYSIAWHGGNMKLNTKDCPRTGKSISARHALISGTREGKKGGTTAGRNPVACAIP
jgi:hypothetical protein